MGVGEFFKSRKGGKNVFWKQDKRNDLIHWISERVEEIKSCRVEQRRKKERKWSADLIM